MGGGIGMGNTCKPMAVSFQCMTKFTTKKKKILTVEWVAISFSRDLPDPGVEHSSPALAGGFFATELPGKPPPHMGVSKVVNLGLSWWSSG